MKVLIAGAGGQVGRALRATSPPGWHITALDKLQLDITDASAVDETVRRLHPDVVINAAAYTRVDQAEREPDKAHAVNAAGAGHLALAAVAGTARLIHISTDFVFDGRQARPYAPDDIPAPLNVYGKSKLAGERRVAEVSKGSGLIVRSAWVYSAHGHNFVNTMLALMRQGSEIRVVFDQVGTPTWAVTLAQAIWAAAARPGLAGVYHWTDDGVASWYDFAVAIQEEAQTLGLVPPAVAIRPIRSADYPAPAVRPAYSVLDKSRTLADFGVPAVHWRQALRTMLAGLQHA
jgi:dTDP-4-dehydrorhamnose reductase